MSAIARKGDPVKSPTGTGTRCGSSQDIKVDQVNSSSVFANSKLIVVKDNKVQPHNKAGCSPDQSVLDKHSSNVFIGGKNVGRKGDEYGTGTPEANVIKDGSPNVFANG